jgi:3-hydroxyisobutyrate dehydrogenase
MTDPRETIDLAKELAQRDIHLIDAPAIGTPEDAKAGRLKFIAGGSLDIIEKSQPIFAALGTQVIHAGSVGAGQAATAISDYLRGVEMLAAAEAMRIGHSFVLDPSGLLRIGDELGGLGPGVRAALQSEVETGRFESGVVLGQVLKNIAATGELAQRAGFDAQLLAACRRAWLQAEAGLGSGADYTRIARWVAMAAPVPASDDREQAA